LCTAPGYGSVLPFFAWGYGLVLLGCIFLRRAAKCKWFTVLTVATVSLILTLLNYWHSGKIL